MANVSFGKVLFFCFVVFLATSLPSQAFTLDPDFDYDNAEGLSSRVEPHVSPVPKRSWIEGQSNGPTPGPRTP